ncbi:MAG: rod shape-determining protein MreD [Massilibacteroides sp.]|nr:rod shape-determining protein MreD [Massilibacteroides sp.]MDD3062748.1 rod shape-determining protein MreD [Massilibacteroides sp.]MDD4115495.1 rod shape-determining protein MreD [Massilibacteroides sp.]MDD4661312.1 rod shape-determining protein MreD [Massilibacteroides sp.]
MINTIFKGIIYFIIFVSVQILVLNNIHYLRIATPFIYLYFLIKLPIGISKSVTLIISFVTGLTIDLFSNTPGMHAAACTFVGFYRSDLIRLFWGKDLPEGVSPSYAFLGISSFLRYVSSFVLLHHIFLFFIESLTLFDPLFLALRIFFSTLLSIVLIAIVEAFNMEAVKNGE